MSIDCFDPEIELKTAFLGGFEQMLKDIQEEYDNVCAVNKMLREQLATWNKDEEIQNYKEQAEYCRSHCLHWLTDKEYEAVRRFRSEHYHSCNNGGTYLFELAGTGIGEAISIKCPVCGKEENITDYDCW